MATRPIFTPSSGSVGVNEKLIEFKWFSGFAKSQKQKSIDSLHQEAKLFGYDDLLEISSKSENPLGISLSAFNLMITTKKHQKTFSVESAFQGSKVFEKGGPYTDLLLKDSLTAKRDIRLKESGNLIHFEFFGQRFPNVPRTFFYDWLYINALVQNNEICEKVKHFEGFTDIEFNPERSINCQAHAVALFISLSKNELLGDALSSAEDFLAITKHHYDKQARNVGVQSQIF